MCEKIESIRKISEVFSMAKSQNTARKTMAKIVIDVFLKRDATSPETAIAIQEFKNVKMTSSVISYTIGNLMQDGIVQKTDDDRFYFVEEQWKKLQKKVKKAYWILLGMPLFVLIIVLLFQYGNDLSKIFFQ